MEYDLDNWKTQIPDDYDPMEGYIEAGYVTELVEKLIKELYYTGSVTAIDKCVDDLSLFLGIDFPDHWPVVRPALNRIEELEKQGLVKPSLTTELLRQFEPVGLDGSL